MLFERKWEEIREGVFKAIEHVETYIDYENTYVKKEALEILSYLLDDIDRGESDDIFDDEGVLDQSYFYDRLYEYIEGSGAIIYYENNIKIICDALYENWDNFDIIVDLVQQGSTEMVEVAFRFLVDAVEQALNDVEFAYEDPNSWSSYTFKTGLRSDAFKQYLRDRGFYFEPSQDGEYTHFEVKNADEAVDRRAIEITRTFKGDDIYLEDFTEEDIDGK